jgi:hypothetical protein
MVTLHCYVICHEGDGLVFCEGHNDIRHNEHIHFCHINFGFVRHDIMLTLTSLETFLCNPINMLNL